MDNIGLSISKKAFISTVIILLALMLAAGVITQVLPQSRYGRTVVDGRELINPDDYRVLDAPALPFWRVFTAPFEVFVSSDAPTLIVIMFFILLIGGAFMILEKCGLLHYLMCYMIKKFGASKYKMLAALCFVFMLFGSLIGIFEEAVTLVPIGVMLALSLGWDSLVGLGMTIFAFSLGFAAGTFNPFTVAVAQKVSGLPLFSGLWLRIIVFFIIYGVFWLFISRYARKVEKNPEH